MMTISGTRISGPFVLALSLAACGDDSTHPGACPSPTSAVAVLIDASHDGGAWWFPQSGPFDATQPHHGQALADTLRGKGYHVDELARGGAVTSDGLLHHQIVIRAGAFGSYTNNELSAYEAFVACERTLVLVGEFLDPGVHDGVAEMLGIALAGSASGTVTTFATHPITAKVTALPYMAGAVVDTSTSISVQVLGWLDSGEAVMGLRLGRTANVFFIGDTNGLETVPQPLVDNLVTWGF